MEDGAKPEKEPRGPGPLAKRLASGDVKAPRNLARKYYQELYRYAFGMLREPAPAQDAVQASFEKAFAALGRYLGERIEALALRPWLYRIVLNVVRNMVRDGKQETPLAETRRHRRRGDPGGVAGRCGGYGTLAGAAERGAVALGYLADLPYTGISKATG